MAPHLGRLNVIDGRARGFFAASCRKTARVMKAVAIQTRIGLEAGMIFGISVRDWPKHQRFLKQGGAR